MNRCCLCLGGPPSYRCKCSCHRNEDCEYWETAAYAWIYDAPTDEARENAWHRFCMAFPEHAHEGCKHFWERIQNTRWHYKHHHEYKRHHHGYGDIDRDDEN